MIASLSAGFGELARDRDGASRTATLAAYGGFDLTDTFSVGPEGELRLPSPVVGALSLFDFSLIDAARTLGCSYPAALTRVLVPPFSSVFYSS